MRDIFYNDFSVLVKPWTAIPVWFRFLQRNNKNLLYINYIDDSWFSIFIFSNTVPTISMFLVYRNIEVS